MDARNALEVSFLYDINTYFLPILEGGLAVRHVALHIRRLFKIDYDIVICKPRTRVPLPGGLVLLPGRAVTVCSAVQRKVVASSVCRDGAVEDEASLGGGDDITTDAVYTAFSSYIAPSLTVRVDAIVCPQFKRGVAAYCIYEPLRTASRDAVLAVKANDIQIQEYTSGGASRNAADCELRALADALCHADAQTYCGAETRIDVLSESTYGIHVIRSLQVRRQHAVPVQQDQLLQDDGCVARIKTVLDRHAVHMKWSSPLTYERGRLDMTDLRRVAVAACRRCPYAVALSPA